MKNLNFLRFEQILERTIPFVFLGIFFGSSWDAFAAPVDQLSLLTEAENKAASIIKSNEEAMKLNEEILERAGKVGIALRRSKGFSPSP